MNTNRKLFPAHREVAACVLLLSLTLTGCAHTPEPIGPEGIIGERARVQLYAGHPHEGILRGLEGDTVTLETEREALFPIQLSPTARLEISRGMKDKAGRGAGFGALIGGVGLAIVGATGCGDGGWVDPGPGACAAGGAIVGAGAGALIGLIIGSTLKEARWVEVDWTRQRTRPRGQQTAGAP